MIRTRFRPAFSRFGRRLWGALLLALPMLHGPAGLAADGALPYDISNALQARSVGPALIGGRIMAITGIPGEPDTLFVGGATSGVWKTEDAGITWTPIADHIDTSSIGAIAIDPANPDIIWVGTGEPKPRYGTGLGTGVYKSTDGGQTWRQMGLVHSERIQRILIDPSDPDTAYVAAVGPAWSDGEQRGVFKTEDGGESWTRVLFTTPGAGAADLVMDPQNPDKLFAAMWDFRREPWFFTSGGDGSGLYVTENGGKSWRKLGPEDGLPAGTIGRIGLAIAPTNPDRVYALVEAEESGLYRSDDGGESWALISNSKRQFTILSRPWYFQLLAVDPQDADRVYHLHDQLEVSADGGRSFENITGGRGVHPDQHALWIDPANPSVLWLGGDGGVFMTRTGGQAWRFVDNLPMAQLYNVTLDNETPYNLYTTIQDQANWRGPSSVWHHDGLTHGNWRSFVGGESSFVLPIAGDPRHVYSLGNMGPLFLTDTLTGAVQVISPVGPTPDAAIRRNNAAAVALDPFDADALYYGSQYVHKSTDRGKSWAIISPDLTTNNPDKQNYWNSGGLTWENFGGSTHTTIIVIAPSPLDPDVIWVGTDDGNIQLTTDGGKNWRNTGRAIAAPRAGFWVASIEPSHFSATEALVAVNDYRRGDQAAYLYRTTDNGETWQPLARPEVRGPGHFIEQDPAVPDLLFWGTEFGLYVSLDGGGRWGRFAGGLPMATVRGTAVHAREADLAIATFGRGAYVLDDIRPLRALAQDPALPEKDIHIFDIPPAQQHIRDRKIYWTAAAYRGQNKPYGAMITYYVKTGGTARITIKDADGTTVRSFEDVAAQSGLNRFVWDLNYAPSASVPSYYEGWGPTHYGAGEVAPGTYTVSVAVGSAVATGDFEIKADPRMAISAADRDRRAYAIGWLQAAVAALMAGYHEAGAYADALDGYMATRPSDATRARAEALKGEIVQIRRRIHMVFGQRDVMAEPYDETMRREWPGGVLDYVTRLVWPPTVTLTQAPTPMQLTVLRNAEARMRAVADDFNRLMAGEMRAFGAETPEFRTQAPTMPSRIEIPDFRPQ